MEANKKPPCNYGSRCYRKNPKHFEDFSHPSTSTHNLDVLNTENLSKDVKAQEVKNSLGGKTKMKQTTIQFGTNKSQKEECMKEVRKDLINETEKNIKLKNLRDKKKVVMSSSQKEKQNTKRNVNNLEPDNFNKKRKRNKPENQESDNPLKKPKNSKLTLDEDMSCKTELSKNTLAQEDDGNIVKSNDEHKSDDVKNVNSSWTYVKKDLKNSETNKSESVLKNKSVEDIIKTLFLVEMPPCFYSFFEFCKSLNKDNPEKSLQICKLNLVGPYDVLLGKMKLSVSKEIALCHWRFFYDPPEFQTILASSTEFHIGYWRDDPNEFPVFLASNDSAKDCVIKMEAENIFGAVFHYCENFIKACDPFSKVEVSKLQKELRNWAEKYNFLLEQKTNKMIERQKKVVTKSFHKLGLVVPVDKKTELGYRPLIETEKNIKKICTMIINADDDNERESFWEKLQPLITAANIANDECDFGYGLELGIDLFCMGSSVFHETVEHLLTVAYSLLNRQQFEYIIRAHLKRRKKGVDLSVN